LLEAIARARQRHDEGIDARECDAPVFVGIAGRRHAAIAHESLDCVVDRARPRPLVREQFVDSNDLGIERAERCSAVPFDELDQVEKRHTLELVIEPERVIEVETQRANARWAGA
jgi:hypothetical protein